MARFRSTSRSEPPIDAASTAFELNLTRPEQLTKLPPCQAGCPGGGDVRGWIGIVAQRQQLGLSFSEACTRAWRMLVAYNPFPATMGRVCPHPCEASCNRQGKDGAVAINALERFLGDWALEHHLPLPREADACRSESIGVIGSGPAGLSFAYQMARHGYPVSVYEKHAKPGGMLTYGIPEYRLPESVALAEIQRILDMGVQLHLSTAVGEQISAAELHDRHALVFLGIGAQKGRMLGIPGEEGPGLWAGTTYLERVNTRQGVDVGGRVVVVGGGNTAVDAARAARRQGAEVTLVYRRTREEMPAIASEIEDALLEEVRFEYLAAPVSICRQGNAIRFVQLQKMKLGAPDESGRRRPVPIPGAFMRLPADTVIAAISQDPDWEGLQAIEGDLAYPSPGQGSWVGEHLLAGGDVLNLGIASMAIGQGRLAAEQAHARLRGLSPPMAPSVEPITKDHIRYDYYPAAARTVSPRRPVEEWLIRPDEEVVATIGEGDFLREVGRCLSCGQCFGCQQCAMYCNPRGYTRVIEPHPGGYFALVLDRCEGCGKCIELCPCGFLSTRPSEH